MHLQWQQVCEPSENIWISALIASNMYSDIFYNSQLDTVNSI